MDFRWCFIVLFNLFSFFLFTLCNSQIIPIPSFTPASLRKYSSGLNYYWHILLDEDSLYVGAQNLLLRLSKDNIEDRSSPLYKSVDIPSKRDEVQKCLSHSLNQAFDCENHVRVLLRRKTKFNDLFVCSTNAFSPKIYYFNPDLTEKLPTKEGFGYCSRDPRHNNTALWSDSGNPSNYGFIYSGAVMDYTKTEPIIYRPPSEDSTIKYMRTPQYDIDWLSAPEFIASFDVDSYIYFFFREKAEEQKSYEPTLSHVYSRVGRVCKNDIGSAPIMANYWTSFRKARIICMSGTSDTPYVFNDISAVAKLYDDRFVVSFTTTPGDLTTSVICEYTQKDIDSVLEGTFKEADSSSFWRELPRDHMPEGVPKNCDSNQNLSDTVLSFLRSHVLIHGNIYTRPPFQIAFQSSNMIVTKLVSDYISITTGNNAGEQALLLYVGTSDGRILKLLQKKKNGKYQWLSTWIIEDKKIPIRNMIIAEDTKQLYVSTDAGVYQLPVAQCNRYTLCVECERDPLCHYDVQHSRCAESDDGPKSAARHSLELWCKKSVQRPAKVFQLTRKIGETVWLQCDVNEHLHSNIEWRWNGQNIQESMYTNYLLTKEQNLIIAGMNTSLNGQYTCFVFNQPIVSYTLDTDRDSPNLFAYGSTSNSLSTTLSKRDCTCITAEKYIEKYNDWCKEFENYQRAYNEWEILRDQSCPKP